MEGHELTYGVILRHDPIRLNAVLEAVQLPAGVAHLDAGLSNVDRNHFALKLCHCTLRLIRSPQHFALTDLELAFTLCIEDCETLKVSAISAGISAITQAFGPIESEPWGVLTKIALRQKGSENVRVAFGYE